MDQRRTREIRKRFEENGDKNTTKQNHKGYN